MREYTTHSYEETLALAEKIASSLPKGSVIAFIGGLGMGKTAFTKGLAVGLGIDCDVFSPTFSICNSYVSEKNTLYHYDMYRVDGWDDLYSTGFFDVLGTDAYIAIEWSENIYSALPNNTVIVEIQRIDENSRRFMMYDIGE
ncbi:MAG: tRNA (adenosine(37)-N6)-threonylcarbamoyltransferase complex ATPase subunit type 1 TsaE [Clostridiales bacterium]|nr:tRNA (adenosine(37)-N6)-threonylcarbamoyltransferase complex ATPase subunit type 1 TsaE [Clostridiales bacterium]